MRYGRAQFGSGAPKYRGTNDYTEMDYRDTSGISPAGLLAAAAVGVYVLVVAGATASVADAAATCGTWPTCEGSVGFDTPALLIAWGHRLLAALIAVFVVGAAVATWLSDSPTSVRTAATVAALLYPLQVGLGALTAIHGAPAEISGAHLGVGITIFVAVVVALAWELQAETAGAHEPLDEDTNAASGSHSPTESPSVAEHPSDENVPRDASEVGLVGTAAAYFRLTKPKLWWLLCLVAAAAMALAVGPALELREVVLTLSGGVLAIAASGTYNHVLERDVDRRMNRTSDRPLATDVVSVRNAVAFGLLLTVASLVLFLQLNVLAAALGLSAILFYSVVYTLVLKPNTVQNTVLGGAAGALPALIGWAAVTGRIGVPALALALVIFLWTPAHFYNLAMAYREDYERGGFPMLPVVRGAAVARKHVLLYLGATLAAAATLAWLTTLGPLYAATTVGFGVVFLWAVLRLHRERTRGAAMRAFHASNAYLGALLLAIVVDAIAL